MADDQEPSNDVGEGGEAPEISDYEEQTTSVIGIGNATTPLVEAYDDEPIEDYVVNMVVNEQSDGASLSPDLINAAITDSDGNIISSRTKLYDSINGYTTAIYDELNGNGTANTDGKRWWGWSTGKIIFWFLVALCILGIILAIVFLLAKKFNKKKSTPAGSSTTTKAVVTKGVSPDSKYHQVPNV
jgi:hypothetical protein